MSAQTQLQTDMSKVSTVDTYILDCHNKLDDVGYPSVYVLLLLANEEHRSSQWFSRVKPGGKPEQRERRQSQVSCQPPASCRGNKTCRK